MLVVVKKPPINFTVSGKIPKHLLDSLTSEYKNYMHIEFEEEEDTLMEVQEMAWYKESKAEETPGGNLRFYRRLAHMNQTELGSKLGISKQFVSNMENGIKPISRAMALKLGSLFDVPAGRFI